MTYAADIYLSNSGSDTNDGFSAGTPVKTLSRAFTISLEGDIIHVMNMININDEPKTTGARGDIDITGLNTAKVLTVNGVTYTTWNTVNGTMGIIPHTRSISIVGDDKVTCGFDGNNTSCIIRHDHSAGTAVINYKNLTFKNGKTADNSGGGAVYLRLSAETLGANFNNCEFINNASKDLKPGGAVCVLPGTVSFTSCRFAGNMASKGAALYTERGTVSIDSCVFEDNDISSSTTSLGGAIAIALIATTNPVLSLDVKNTLFKNNKAANGGAFSANELNASTATAKFTNCAFVGNTAVTGVGGAAYIDNKSGGSTLDISFINSTFTQNSVGGTSGGGIFVSSLLTNSKFNLINCTISANKVSGTTGIAGAGVCFKNLTVNSTRKILNSILENNTAVDADPSSVADYADLKMEDNVDATPSYVAGTTLVIDKSIIGSCNNTDFSTQFPTNTSNYAAVVNGSVANSYVAKLGVFNTIKNYFPLISGSPAINYGDATYLSSLTPAVTTDQIGRTRPAVNCSAGAYEFATVSGLKNTVNNLIKVYKNANNQIIVTNADATTANGSITICNMVGQVMFNSPINGSVTTINKSLTSGVYLVMVNINGNINTKKVMLN